MKEMMRYGFILALICTLASASLAVVNSLTKSKIMAQEAKEEEASLREVMPLAIDFQAVKSGNDIIYYRAYAKDGKFIGIAFKTQAKGYSSDIQAMVGLTKDGTITAIKILSQNETPGLGAKVAEADFTNQFRNKQNLEKAQAITGATISSGAVINSVKKKVEELKNFLKDEK